MTNYSEEFFIKAISSELSIEELEGFEKWLDQNPAQKERYLQLKATWETAGSLQPKTGRSGEERWKSLNSRISDRRSNKRALISGIAASLLLAASLIIYFSQNQSVTTLSATDDTGIYFLPDSSKVFLKVGSSLTYSNRFSKQRHVKLGGEGFFEVRKSKSPFVVSTTLGQVKVLGTSFNVKENMARMTVVCLTGRVEVSDPGNQGTPTQVLTKGTKTSRTSISAFGTPVIVKNPEAFKSWMDGNIYFEGELLETVLDEIAAIHSVKVDVPQEVESMRFTGLLPVGDLAKSLDIVCLSSNTTYRLEKNQVIISGN